jgi:serine protease Do
VVQDVTPGSPGARAGLRLYDLIVAVDGKPIAGNDELIQLIASREPGTMATLQVVRDGRSMNVPVKLAERPQRDRRAGPVEDRPQPSGPRPAGLGLSVREIDQEFTNRFGERMEGVIVSRVEPMGPAFDAEIERGHVLLEINRTPVRSYEDYRRLTASARPGDILTLYVLKPEAARRELHTIRID